MRATVRRWGAVHDERWLVSLVAARLAATAFAAALIVWGGPSTVELLLLIYGPASTALLVALPSLRRSPWAWAVDFVATLVLILASNDWRSPFYLLWLVTLALPATELPLRKVAGLAVASPLAFPVRGHRQRSGSRTGNPLGRDSCDPPGPSFSALRVLGYVF